MISRSDDFRGKWKMGNIHSLKKKRNLPVIGMIYSGVNIQTKEKDVGILKSLEEQEALLENVEGEEFKAKIDSLKFIEITQKKVAY